MNIRIALVVASLAVSIAIGLVIGRGGAAAAGAHRPRIGLSLDTTKEPRWQADSELFRRRCEDLGASVDIQNANGDDTQQVKDVQTLLSKGEDVIVVVAHNGDAMAKAVELAHAEKVPVIAYDRLIMNCDLDVYLSFDNVKVGRLQAQWVIDHLPHPGHGKIVRVNGSKTDNNAFLFKQGQDEVLEPYIKRGDIQIIFEDWADDWRPDNAKRIVNAAITTHGKDFDGVIAAADGIAGGSYQALLENGLAGKVILTGQDADLVNCQRIVAGTQSMTIYKPLKKLAGNAAEIADKIARRQVIVANATVNNHKIDVPSVLGDVYTIDRTNMDIVIRDGFHTREEIYGEAR